MRLRIVPALVFVSIVAGPFVAARQTTGPRNPPLVIRSLAGKDLFEFYCATCHGRDGRGNGPVVAALKVAPPDLTLLARRHQGTFPRQRVEAFITNDGGVLATAHGSSDMPVWGPVFRGLEPSDHSVTVRLANIVTYLESIQAKE